MIITIDDKNKFDLLQQTIIGTDCIVIPVFINDTYHPGINKLSALIIHTSVDDTNYVLGISHPDILYKSNYKQLLDSCSKVFIYRKIDFLYFYDDHSKLYDIDLISWFETGKLVQEQPSIIKTFYTRKYPKLIKLNCIIPIYKLVESNNYIINKAIELIRSNTYQTAPYTAYNNDIILGLYSIEKNGFRSSKGEMQNYFPGSNLTVHFKDDIVYTQYNPYTTTGRPTCRYNSINFTAMNKENGCRNIITSRFEGGKLIEFDYESYHLRIIADIIQYSMPEDISVHEYLGRQYFGVSELTPEQYAQSKTVSFRQLYGGVEPEFKAIDFFNKVDEFVNSIWIQWCTKGYIETAIYKHKLLKVNYSDMNKSKLFNYFIQSSETEYSIRKILLLQEYLKDKETKVILYAYDAILLDVPIEEKNNLVEIQSLLSGNGFPTVIKMGKTYHNMKKVKFNHIYT